MAFDSKDAGPDKRTGFTFKGKEIVLSKTRGRPFNGIRKRPGYYPEEKRIEAVAIFAATGSADRVGELTGVPVGTVRGWTREEWFQKLLDEIRAENDHLIDAKFNEILNKSLELVMDRMEHGDYHVLRDGTLVRKPVGLRDLTISQAITIDKRQLLRGKPTTRTEQVNPQKQIEDKLQTLAEAFKKLAGGTTRRVEVTDAEVIEIKEYDKKESESSRDDGPDVGDGVPSDFHSTEGNSATEERSAEN